MIDLSKSEFIFNIYKNDIQVPKQRHDITQKRAKIKIKTINKKQKKSSFFTGNDIVFFVKLTNESSAMTHIGHI